MITRAIRKEKDVYPVHDVVAVDGDTIKARVVLAFGQSIELRIRLKGWWADEPIGLHAEAGLAAHNKLQGWLKGKVLWIWSRSERQDKYGRTIAHLIHNEQVVDPRKVLGEHQLTEEVHRLHRDQQKSVAAQFRPKAPWSGYNYHAGRAEPEQA